MNRSLARLMGASYYAPDISDIVAICAMTLITSTAIVWAEIGQIQHHRLGLADYFISSLGVVCLLIGSSYVLMTLRRRASYRPYLVHRRQAEAALKQVVPLHRVMSVTYENQALIVRRYPGQIEVSLFNRDDSDEVHFSLEQAITLPLPTYVFTSKFFDVLRVTRMYRISEKHNQGKLISYFERVDVKVIKIAVADDFVAHDLIVVSETELDQLTMIATRGVASRM